MSTIVTDSARERPPIDHFGGRFGLAGALAAEWTKLWTTRTAYVCLPVAALLMAVFTFYYGSLARINDEPVQPVGSAPVSAAVLVQFAFVVLAMTTVTSEYTTGSIRASLLWVPVRGRLQWAKALVAGAVSFCGGVVLGVLGTTVSWMTFRGHATFEPAEAIGQVLSLGAYLAAVAVLTVGVSFAVRSAAGVLALVSLLLAGLPMVLLGLGGKTLLTINDYLPQSAGAHFMKGEGDTYAPVVGLAIVVTWSAAAHLTGLIALRRRDA
ncbi:ABC transporter permease [Streptomyces sp. NPDC003077]|uniref:ABC transporter permease n=1 Tax=Streptomyces sp. NPDC003077 TaxID=3154443 RepID=UPI0033AEAA2D